MPAYRLRDVAVLIGAVVVGAAAGFNGGWLAAVPPKVVTVDTPNKLATGNTDIRTAPTVSAQDAPPIATTEATANPAPPSATAESTPQFDTRNVRVIRPVEQANEISASAQQSVAPSPTQAVSAPAAPALPPADNKAAPVVGASPQPAPVPPTPAVKTEAPTQAASTESEAPRTTGQGGSRKSDVNKSESKKTSQTASDQKTKRKEAKRREAAPETATGEGDRSEVGPDVKSGKKAIVQKAKKREIRRQEEFDSDDSEVVESESRPATTGRSFRREEREEHERVPARERMRAPVTVERERERAPREVVVEEPRERSGPLDFFFGR